MTLARPTRLLAADAGADAPTTHVHGLPPLAPIDWQAGGFTPPQPLDTPATLPKADAVVIVWADAEWAAMHHVFCASAESMPHSRGEEGDFPGWQKDAANLVAGPAEWTYWGDYRLVQVGETRVLLYKSNTHLDYPGEAALKALIQRLAAIVQPKLIVSTGTAGGANATDHVGTVPIVSSATRYEAGKPPANWPRYAGAWRPQAAALKQASFAELLMPIPITPAALNELVSQFNAHGSTSYTLEQLDPLGLNLPDPVPAIHNLSGGTTSLLTASTFLVGTTDNRFDAYACIEMDDAVVAAECSQAGVLYGSVRNLSDPAQNPDLPPKAQGDWGSTIYKTYGFYTSFNGALAAWATIST
jgi:nucleoside phosphorylase